MRILRRSIFSLSKNSALPFRDFPRNREKHHNSFLFELRPSKNTKGEQVSPSRRPKRDLSRRDMRE